MPSCDEWNTAKDDIRILLQDCLDVTTEEKGRWKVDIKEHNDSDIIHKAADWFQDYLFDIGYPDDWCRDSKNLVSGKDRFIKAMKDESERLD